MVWKDHEKVGLFVISCLGYIKSSCSEIEKLDHNELVNLFSGTNPGALMVYKPMVTRRIDVDIFKDDYEKELKQQIWRVTRLIIDWLKYNKILCGVVLCYILEHSNAPYSVISCGVYYHE